MDDHNDLHFGPPVTSYGAHFGFRYTADARVHESSVDLSYNSSIRSDIEHWMEQMPAGSHQRIRYDPGNPANISLAVDYTPRSFMAPFALAKWAGVIAAVSVILFWLGWRAGKGGDTGVTSVVHQGACRP